MGKAPEGTSIDRINNNKGYSKSNCRWASHKQQVRNRSNTVFVTAFGKTLPLSDWADQLGCQGQTIAKRLDRGWNAERAVTEKVQTQKKETQI